MNYHMYLLTHVQVEMDWLRRARSIITVNPWQRTLMDNWFRARGNSLVSLNKWEVLPEKDWEDRFKEWVVSTWWPNARPKAKAKPGKAANSAVPEPEEDSSYDSYTSYYSYYSDEYSSSKSPPLRGHKTLNSGQRAPSSSKGKQKGKGKFRRSRSGRRPRTGAGQAEDASEQYRSRGPGGRGQGFRGCGKGGSHRSQTSAEKVAGGHALHATWSREMKEANQQQQMQLPAANAKPEDVAMHDADEASVQTKAETESKDVPMRPPPDEFPAETAVSAAPAVEPAASAAAEPAISEAVDPAVSAAAETVVPVPPTAGTAPVRRRQKRGKKCAHPNCGAEATSGCRVKRCAAHCEIMLQDADKQCRVHP